MALLAAVLGKLFGRSRSGGELDGAGLGRSRSGGELDWAEGGPEESWTGRDWAEVGPEEFLGLFPSIPLDPQI